MRPSPATSCSSMSGQTIEVINTDAEGRLILCDALTYARRFKPAVVVDIATLTGACVIALGAHLAAVMSNDDGTRRRTRWPPAQRAEDRCWHMPMAEEYHEQLKSNFADFANSCGREGGAITAACFLAKFTDGPALGAPRHRGHGVPDGRAERQHRPAGAAAGRFPASTAPDRDAGRDCAASRLLPARRLPIPAHALVTACRLAEKGLRAGAQGRRAHLRSRRDRRSSTNCCGPSATAASCRIRVWPRRRRDRGRDTGADRQAPRCPRSHRDVLINLASDAPDDFAAYARVCEVVGGDEDGQRAQVASLAHVPRRGLRARSTPALTSARSTHERMHADDIPVLTDLVEDDGPASAGPRRFGNAVSRRTRGAPHGRRSTSTPTSWSTTPAARWRRCCSSRSPTASRPNCPA